MNDEFDDVEDALRRQDEALALLERLRLAEPMKQSPPDPVGGGRRDFRRWPAPEGVTLDLHDGAAWQRAEIADLGIGGVRLETLPPWLQGPAPARLVSGTAPPSLVLADIMWRDGAGGGLRFEFDESEERDRWTAALIDALLARYALN